VTGERYECHRWQRVEDNQGGPVAILRSAVGEDEQSATHAHPPKVLLPCPCCNKKFGARDIRVHKPPGEAGGSNRTNASLISAVGCSDWPKLPLFG
jgi:hypothetical protein